MEPTKKQYIGIEKSIATSATVQDPEVISVTLGASRITGLTFGCRDVTNSGEVYFKIFGRNGGLLFPARTSQPIAAGVPAGWAPVPHGGEITIPLSIDVPGPDWDISLQVVNYGVASADFTAFIAVGSETVESLLARILSQLELMETMFTAIR